MDRYEALLQLYEARNAAGIASAASAQQYAPQPAMMEMFSTRWPVRVLMLNP